MVRETTPVTSLKLLKTDVDALKRQAKQVDAKLILRLLDYIESREKLTKDLLIHMNAVEGHIVRVTELLQKLPQVNIGLLADSLQAMIPKLDEIAYNTRKMVDYLEIAAEIEPEEKEMPRKKEKREEDKPEVKTGDKPEPKKQLKKIEEQNKQLIGALENLSDNLEKVGSK
jgi:hypothetical protein